MMQLSIRIKALVPAIGMTQMMTVPLGATGLSHAQLDTTLMTRAHRVGCRQMRPGMHRIDTKAVLAQVSDQQVPNRLGRTRMMRARQGVNTRAAQTWRHGFRGLVLHSPKKKQD